MFRIPATSMFIITSTPEHDTILLRDQAIARQTRIFETDIRSLWETVTDLTATSLPLFRTKTSSQIPLISRSEANSNTIPIPDSNTSRVFSLPGRRPAVRLCGLRSQGRFSNLRGYLQRCSGTSRPLPFRAQAQQSFMYPATRNFRPPRYLTMSWAIAPNCPDEYLWTPPVFMLTMAMYRRSSRGHHSSL